jgi:hypothetical protein
MGPCRATPGASVGLRPHHGALASLLSPFALLAVIGLVPAGRVRPPRLNHRPGSQTPGRAPFRLAPTCGGSLVGAGRRSVPSWVGQARDGPPVAGGRRPSPAAGGTHHQPTAGNGSVTFGPRPAVTCRRRTARLITGQSSGDRSPRLWASSDTGARSVVVGIRVPGRAPAAPGAMVRHRSRERTPSRTAGRCLGSFLRGLAFSLGFVHLGAPLGVNGRGEVEALSVRLT